MWFICKKKKKKNLGPYKVNDENEKLDILF